MDYGAGGSPASGAPPQRPQSTFAGMRQAGYARPPRPRMPWEQDDDPNSAEGASAEPPSPSAGLPQYGPGYVANNGGPKLPQYGSSAPPPSGMPAPRSYYNNDDQIAPVARGPAPGSEGPPQGPPASVPPGLPGYSSPAAPPKENLDAYGKPLPKSTETTGGFGSDGNKAGFNQLDYNDKILQQVSAQRKFDPSKVDLNKLKTMMTQTSGSSSMDDRGNVTGNDTRLQLQGKAIRGEPLDDTELAYLQNGAPGNRTPYRLTTNADGTQSVGIDKGDQARADAYYASQAAPAGGARGTPPADISRTLVGGYDPNAIKPNDTNPSVPTTGGVTPPPATPQGGNGTGGGGGQQPTSFDVNTYLRNQLLNNPTGYDDTAANNEWKLRAQGIDDRSALEQTKIREELAARGLADSTELGGRLKDQSLLTRSAKVAAAQDVAAKRAEALSQGRKDWYDRLFRTSQTGTENDQWNAEFNRRRDKDQQDFFASLLGPGR